MANKKEILRWDLMGSVYPGFICLILSEHGPLNEKEIRNRSALSFKTIRAALEPLIWVGCVVKNKNGKFDLLYYSSLLLTKLKEISEITKRYRKHT